MTELIDVIADRSAKHAREARARRGSDLSYSMEDGIHRVTWHTQDGYDFLSKRPDSNLALWHSIFTDDDAEERVQELLRVARENGLSIYNDRSAWRRAMPSTVIPAVLGVTALAIMLFALVRSSSGPISRPSRMATDLRGREPSFKDAARAHVPVEETRH